MHSDPSLPAPVAPLPPLVFSLLTLDEAAQVERLRQEAGAAFATNRDARKALDAWGLLGDLVFTILGGTDPRKAAADLFGTGGADEVPGDVEQAAQFLAVAGPAAELLAAEVRAHRAPADATGSGEEVPDAAA